MWRTGVIILCCALAGFCNNAERSYRGDGRFVDNGISAARHRYVLDLGRVFPGSKVYNFGFLPPNVDFIITLKLPRKHLLEDDVKRITGEITQPIHILLKEQESWGYFILLDHKVPFKDWTWSSSGYEGGSFAQFAYLSPDKYAYGSWFSAKYKGVMYQLRVEIPNVKFFIDHPVHLVIVGGGWKS